MQTALNTLQPIFLLCKLFYLMLLYFRSLFFIIMAYIMFIYMALLITIYVTDTITFSINHAVNINMKSLKVFWPNNNSYCKYTLIYQSIFLLRIYTLLFTLKFKESKLQNEEVVTEQLINVPFIFFYQLI